MKVRYVAALLASTMFFGGCVQLPPVDGPTSRISPDYVVTGDVGTMKAFVYGKRTVLTFKNEPGHLSVYDETGQSIGYEREGKYYLLSKKLDKFNVWFDMRAVRVAASPLPKPAPAEAPASAVAAPIAQTPITVEAVAAPKASDDAEALLKVSEQQLKEVRQAIKDSKGNPAETALLNKRLDRIESQLVTAATAIVRIQFDTTQTEFKPSDEVAKALVPAAMSAERVNVRGRTDSKIAGQDDPRIAMARALSARKFLVDNGVDASKIKVFSLPAGDFIAPSSTEDGKRINRRVEIELVNQRYAALTKRLASLTQTQQ